MDIGEGLVEVQIPGHRLDTKSWWPGLSSNAVNRPPIGPNDPKVRIHYVKAGEGPAVILIHGLGASLSVWRDNIEVLAQNNTVYALDLPGHGKSDKPLDIGYDAVSGAHFLYKFMDELSIPRATLIGNSGGGLVTAICALIYKQRVERLMLVDSAGLGRSMAWFLRFESVPLIGEFLQLPNVRTPKNLVKTIFYNPVPVDDPIVRELISVRKNPAAKKAVLKAVRSAINLWGLRRNVVVLDKLNHLAAPLMIVWGREDMVIPVSHAYSAAKVLPSAQVHVIPYCGHWPQLEKAPEFNSLIAEFIAQR